MQGVLLPIKSGLNACLMNAEERKFLKAYDQYADAIFRHCFFRVFSREIARDLVQDTFIKTWEYLSSGRNIENMQAFLYRVATNLIIDYSRKNKEISLDGLLESGYEPSLSAFANASADAPTEEVSKKLDVQFVIQKVRELEEIDREVITLRYVEDLSPGEIADILGVSENVVSVRIHRALKRLTELLKGT